MYMYIYICMYIYIIYYIIYISLPRLQDAFINATLYFPSLLGISIFNV